LRRQLRLGRTIAESLTRGRMWARNKAGAREKPRGARPK
jgi:hypothetical protein